MVIAYKVHPAWITNLLNKHSSVSDIVTKEASITLHYITEMYYPHPGLRVSLSLMI